VRENLVPAPNLILTAEASHELTQLDADRYLALAMFSAPDGIPFEYLAPAAQTVAPQWDHSAVTRLIERWEELAEGDQAELLSAVDGLGGLIDRADVAEGRSNGEEEACIPVTAVDVLICVGESVSQDAGGGLPLNEAVVAIRPWTKEAVEDAWPEFEALFGSGPDRVKLYLSDLTAAGGYIFLDDEESGQGGSAGICHIYVDVLRSEETDPSAVNLGDPVLPDGVPVAAQLQATVAHQLFHCFQRAAGLAGFDAALWEGTATWAEHHVYPLANTEARWMTTWVSAPEEPFANRLYDTVFSFLSADLLGGGSGAILDVLLDNSIASLNPNFEEFWHQISVMAWNEDPVDPLINDDGVLVEATVNDIGALELTAEAEGTVMFSVPLYSRGIRTLVFGGGASEQEVADFARLWLDLSQVPNDVRISALAETSDGWLEPIVLTGSDWEFCRMSIGPCNDADPAVIQPFSRIVLIITNVDNGTETFSIPWNTYNPHLHGTWVRTDGPLLTNPGATAPYAIVGTELAFDEPAFGMTEDTINFSLARAETGWECSFSGGYVIAADASYGAALRGDVSGTVTVTEPAEGEPFGNTCVFTTAAGAESQVDGLNIPVGTSPEGTLGFEIRDYDTVWVYAFERIYVYDRVG